MAHHIKLIGIQRLQVGFQSFFGLELKNGFHYYITSKWENALLEAITYYHLSI